MGSTVFSWFHTDKKKAWLRSREAESSGETEWEARYAE